MKRVRVALVGWGAIAQTAAAMLANSPIDIVAVATTGRGPGPRDLPEGARWIVDPAELAAIGADVVAEAASRESVGPWCRAGLDAGADVIVSSVSAFADAALLDELRSHAARVGAQIHIQPGALAGVDALAAARRMGIDTVEHRIVKPPNAWAGTPAEEYCSLDTLTTAADVFRGSAAEAATAFPKNANVAMTSALAGIGPDATEIVLVADPGATTNRHELTAVGAFGRLKVSISNNPLPGNPKSSAMAALSLVRSIENRAVAFVI